MQLVLYEPEIPPNTGNVARLCAATGTRLHLVEPLGFSLEDKYLKRAGLDYWPSVDLTVWPGWAAFTAAQAGRGRLVFSSSHAGERLDRFAFRADDLIVLGPETRGLPRELLDAALAAQETAPGGHVFPDAPGLVRIPILPCVRSLNMSTAAGILLLEALRQTGGLDLLEARAPAGSPGSAGPAGSTGPAH
ncbi:MAG: tRNA (cytidine(34)-2'-O)-methyltransferase [Desulfovibrionaceae bacterium]|jgi:tRNA (cytidine/uridine-2'-O-)-methyltransferase|nr:tRNA (cytidine(34)-2'-O)-methyltransferase [Desulfovibrionaceae bacterium]